MAPEAEHVSRAASQHSTGESIGPAAREDSYPATHGGVSPKTHERVFLYTSTATPQRLIRSVNTFHERALMDGITINNSVCERQSSDQTLGNL